MGAERKAERKKGKTHGREIEREKERERRLVPIIVALSLLCRSVCVYTPKCTIF